MGQHRACGRQVVTTGECQETRVVGPLPVSFAVSQFKQFVIVVVCLFRDISNVCNWDEKGAHRIHDQLRQLIKTHINQIQEV